MPDMLYEKHQEGHYAIFTMNRPDRLNAQGAIMAQELEVALHDFTNDPAMRVGIVTGVGRAFSAGADIKEASARSNAMAELEAQFQRGDITAKERADRLRIYQSGGGGYPFSGNPKPFIAAVNGLAIGAGMNLATDCDIRVASTQSSFGVPEAKIGLMPGSAICMLASVIPFGAAMYLGLTADTWSAEDALRIGYVQEVVEPQRLMPRAIEIAEMIGQNAPLAIQGAKAMGQFRRQFGLDESRRMGASVSRYLASSEDAKEGSRAFLEKRRPIWKGQ